MDIRASQRWIIVEIIHKRGDPDEEDRFYDFAYISKFQAFASDLDHVYGSDNWTIVATAANDSTAGQIIDMLRAQR